MIQFKIKTIFLLSVLFSALVFIPASAQSKYVLGSGPSLSIQGGSTLHDWEMKSSEAKGDGMFVTEGNELKDIKNLTVSMKAETLKSGTRGLDNNAYKALDTKKNPEIKFQLKEFVKNGSAYTAKGDFTIAGVTKPASFPVKVNQSGNSFTFEGKYDTKLTNFSIDPPTALLGTVKTDDAISISFKTTFQKQ
ncbi:YceI family protein [Indibacter alkaliphilus]|nr:YceI family protein [Indibacter alkaliphilus]